MNIQCLGPFVVTAGSSESVPRPCRRSRLLIALLAHANEVVATERLIGEIWGDQYSETSRNSLHAQIARLRKVVHAWSARDGADIALIARYPGYVLLIDDDILDMTHFIRLAAQSRAAWPTDPLMASEYARKALAYFRGKPFAGHDLGPLGQAARVRMEEIRLTTRETLIDSSLELGFHRQLICECEELLIAYPLHERFYEQLMVALYRSGRQGEALALFGQARLRLREDLGVEPSPHLHHRMTQILHHDAGLWERCDSWNGVMLGARRS
jgi:DNA-binding SARP family transcriptional activator